MAALYDKYPTDPEQRLFTYCGASLIAPNAVLTTGKRCRGSREPG